MKKSCLYILTALLMLPVTGSDALAQSGYSRDKFKPFLTRERTEIRGSLGVRRNNFDWNFASDATGTATPNILSELTWEDVTVLELTGNVRHIEPADIGPVSGGIHLEAEGTLGWTLTGDNQDSDFLGDNRTNEFSRSDNDAGNGFYVAGSVAAGYQLTLVGPDRSLVRKKLKARPSTHRGRLLRKQDVGRLTNPDQWIVNVTPLVGYGWDQQEYKIQDGVQTINTLGPGFPPEQGERLPDSNTEYVAEWHGPFFGLESEIRKGKNKVRLRGEYHDLSYYGEAFWRARINLAQDPSRIHEADGEGYVIEANYAYALGPHYALTVDASYRERWAEDGTDQVFFAAGGSAIQKLNEVNDESQALRVGIEYQW